MTIVLNGVLVVTGSVGGSAFTFAKFAIFFVSENNFDFPNYQYTVSNLSKVVTCHFCEGINGNFKFLIYKKCPRNFG